MTPKVPSDQDSALIERTLAHTLDRHVQREGALLPILHELQQELGYIPDQTIPTIARQLNTTAADIHGVISFYHFFHRTEGGQHRVQICRAESCQSMGGRQLEANIKQHLKLDYHQTSADRMITLEPVYCLGNCACSPSIRIDDETYSRVTSEQATNLIDDLYCTAVEMSTTVEMDT